MNNNVILPCDIIGEILSYHLHDDLNPKYVNQQWNKLWCKNENVYYSKLEKQLCKIISLNLIDEIAMHDIDFSNLQKQITLIGWDRMCIMCKRAMDKFILKHPNQLDNILKKFFSIK